MNVQDHLKRLKSEINRSRFQELFFIFIKNFVQGLGALLIADYLLHLDNFPLRIVLFLGVLVWSFKKTYNRQQHPIHQSLNDEDLIRVFERRYPEIQGRWIAAAQLAGFDHPVFDRLRQESESLAHSIPQETLVIWGPLKKLRQTSLLWLAGFCLALLLISPLQLAARRLFQDVAWPLKNQLDLRGVPSVVVRGEPFRLAVMPQPGQRAATETYVKLFHQGDEIQALPMLKNMQGELFALVEGVNENVSLVFEGGDFFSNPIEIKVVDRPQVEQAKVVGEYPDYIDLEPKIFSDEGYNFSFIEGGRLQIELDANKPLKHAKLITESGEVEMMIEGARARVEVPVKSNSDWLVQLTGEHGFDNKNPLHMLIEALKDQPPQVSYQRPRRDLNLGVNAYVDIQGLIEDDFGVALGELMIERVDVTQNRVEKVVTLDKVESRREIQRAFDYRFDFAKQSTQPGEVFKLQVLGQDYLEQTGAGRQLAIHIVHQETIDGEIEANLQEIRKNLEKMVARQEKVIELSSGLAAVLPEISAPDMSLALEKQNSLVSLTDEVFDLMDRVSQLISLNRLSREEIMKLLRAVSTQLNHFQNEELKQAIDSLLVMREQKIGGKSALEAQNQCLRTLRELLSLMGGSQGFMEVVKNIEKIIHMQKEVNEATEKINE